MCGTGVGRGVVFFLGWPLRGQRSGEKPEARGGWNRTLSFPRPKREKIAGGGWDAAHAKHRRISATRSGALGGVSQRGEMKPFLAWAERRWAERSAEDLRFGGSTQLDAAGRWRRACGLGDGMAVLVLGAVPAWVACV